MTDKLVPDWDSTIELDYIKKDLPERVRAEILSILRRGARSRLEEKIAAGAVPGTLTDGSHGWAVGMQWGPPFEGDNAFRLFYLEVRAKHVAEGESIPKPPQQSMADVRRERDALRAENERLRAALREQNDTC